MPWPRKKSKDDGFQKTEPTPEMMEEEVEEEPTEWNTEPSTNKPPVAMRPLKYARELSPKGKMRITEGRVMENGLIIYTIISNKSLGKIGEEFDV